MPETLVGHLMSRVAEAAVLYHRLVLLAGPPGSGKTAVLRCLAQETGFPMVNVNLELSRRLLELTERQRVLRAAALLEDLASEHPGEVLLLDNTELLFEERLRLDPLKCLQKIARNRTVVAAWSGTLAGENSARPVLSFAAPEHPAYRRYPADDLLVVSQPQRTADPARAPGGADAVR